MSILRKQLEIGLSTARRFEEKEGVTKKKLRICLNAYKNLLNTTDETDVPMKFLIFSSIVLMIPKMISTIYFIHENIFFSSTILVFEGFLEFTVTVSPALLAEMINSEIDKMKLCIVRQLLVCRGESTHHVIKEVLVYFRQHPFNYTIYRLFTLNMSMILSVVALLTTYTVAMVQFAHFYN